MRPFQETPEGTYRRAYAQLRGEQLREIAAELRAQFGTATCELLL